jgi:prepilin-type N-terminal cleavage/methylation domain-containing protein
MRAPKSSKQEQGFTLIELLIVIGIIGFLAASVLVAVDPVKRIQDARDARRYSEANGILNAILTKQVDDRSIYNAGTSAPIITSATYSQVIVTSDSGIECDLTLTENFPGCNRTLDNGNRTLTGTVSSASTNFNGDGGNLFLTELRVGDTVTSGASTCVIRSITSNTAAVCVTAPGTPFSTSVVTIASKRCVANISDTRTGLGTITTSGTTVTGSGTNFTAQVNVGDIITVGGVTLTVASVASTTSLTTIESSSVGVSTAYDVTLKNPLLPNYIASAPIDPRGSGSTVCQTGCTTNGVGITTLGSTNTGYYLQRTTGNRLEVGACLGEQTTAISVKR